MNYAKGLLILISMVAIGNACTLFSQYLLEGKIPSNFALRFKNKSNEQVHALFIRTPEFKNVFKVGGWSAKSLDQLSQISLKCAVLFPEEGKVINATPTKESSADEPTTKKARTIKIPKKDTAVAFVNIMGDISKSVIDIFLQPAVILDTIHTKDYFEVVFPGTTAYSYYPAHPGQLATNLKRLTKKGDIVLAIYPNDPKYAGVPNFDAPLFIQDFNFGKYNSVTYGPEPGHAIYQQIDPTTGQKGPEKEKLFVPVITKDGKLYTQTGGKQALKELKEKEEELGVEEIELE